ncbi:MAG: hypothetical protein LBS60_02120 [Deltaproteobacteria bacterium]|jgi:hypothetical protein|nr:hypothetical protein [Deltaproteobacteria bacterium]
MFYFKRIIERVARRFSLVFSRLILPTYLFALFFALSPRDALAQGLGNIGQNVASNFTGVAKAIQMFGFLAGLSLVVMGLMELYHMNKRADATLPSAMTKCAIGAALLAVDALISSFSTTIFGGDKSGGNLGTLGL